jgi:anti-sigma factor RsiW
MKILSCASVRRRLGRWHDGELPPAEHYAVDQHLRDCPPCAAESRALSRLGSLMRDMAAGRVLSADEAAGLRAGVLGRRKAEDAVSFSRWLDEVFEDMHLVLAGLGATAATAVCVALLAGMAYLSPPERADSLSGMLSALAQPGSDRNPVALGATVRPPRGYTGDAVPAALSSATEEDLVFALAAVVTQEGRVSHSEVLHANREDREVVLRLMNAVAEARFQPASRAGEPVAVNLVWLITHTTVRGSKTHS